jgi:SM-20-related protein
MMRASARSIKRIVAELERTGYTVVRGFLDTATCARLAAECRMLHAAGRLRRAAIGRGADRRESEPVRGDHTAWLDAMAATPAQASYWQAMWALCRLLNRRLLLGLIELEAHFALYPPGARYVRHRDRFRNDDARVLSSVLYLNPAWRGSDGGALRLYLPDQEPRDVLPEAGTLVLFLSAEIEHEVLPALRERLSIAGWFRRRGPLPSP